MLAGSDVSSLDPPPPLYIQVSRQAYLHTQLPSITPLWQHVLRPGNHTPWFDYNSLPLKWDVPAGVLYDLLVPDHDELPWNLSLHFSAFPATTLPAYSGADALRGALLNSLKEAAVICLRTAQPVQEMVQGAKDDLWAAVTRPEVALHTQILNSVHLSAPLATAPVPTRVFLRQSGHGRYLSSYQGILQTSRPVAAGGAASLRTALAPLLRAWLPGREEDPWEVVERVWVGGVEPPLETPLVDLHRDLYGPDFFLYVVLHAKPPMMKT